MNENEYFLNEFGPTNFNMANALSILQSPTPDELIFQKPAGKGKSLSYVSGATVIRTINKVFGMRWSFEIIETRMVESSEAYDKPVNPIVQTLGKLTIPGLGSRMQWGSQAVVGGQGPQEHTFKGSATDSLKKCASMFLVHLDLADGGANEFTGVAPQDLHPSDLVSLEEKIEKPVASNRKPVPQPDEPTPDVELSEIDDIENVPTEEVTSDVPQETPVFNKVDKDVVIPEAVQQSIDSVGEPKSQTAQPEQPKQPVQATQPAQTAADQWSPEDIAGLKAHKERLGVTMNEQLNPYVQEFTGSPDTTYQSLSPSTIKDFNHFLSGK